MGTAPDDHAPRSSTTIHPTTTSISPRRSFAISIASVPTLPPSLSRLSQPCRHLYRVCPNPAAARHDGCACAHTLALADTALAWRSSLCV
eukprot:352665-Chlamydomonas_euryale.AAC.4